MFEVVNHIDYFGLDVIMTKTARHWCSALTRTYCDLHIVDRLKFEELLKEFPKENDDFRR